MCDVSDAYIGITYIFGNNMLHVNVIYRHPGRLLSFNVIIIITLHVTGGKMEMAFFVAPLCTSFRLNLIHQSFDRSNDKRHILFQTWFAIQSDAHSTECPGYAV